MNHGYGEFGSGQFGSGEMKMVNENEKEKEQGGGRYALAPLCPRTDVFEPILTTVSPVIVPAQGEVYCQHCCIDHFLREERRTYAYQR